ncbi:MAG: hypothetical protein FWB71_02790 [Defluviitaleaceae bacterium]|nr:hypothetical protein [Defluviitaleaceae bacterium]
MLFPAYAFAADHDDPEGQRQLQQAQLAEMQAAERARIDAFLREMSVADIIGLDARQAIEFGANDWGIQSQHSLLRAFRYILRDINGEHIITRIVHPSLTDLPENSDVPYGKFFVGFAGDEHMDLVNTILDFTGIAPDMITFATVGHPPLSLDKVGEIGNKIARFSILTMEYPGEFPIGGWSAPDLYSSWQFVIWVCAILFPPMRNDFMQYTGISEDMAIFIFSDGEPYVQAPVQTPNGGFTIFYTYLLIVFTIIALHYFIRKAKN